MKTKPFFPLLVMILASCSLFAQKTISLQSQGTATFYTDWPSAWAAALDGDTIYLPGGTFTSNIVIDRKITIIGVGHDPTTTHDNLFSHINGTIYMVEGSDHTHLHGFQFANLYFTNTSSQNQAVNNITVTRCKITGTLNLGGSVPSLAQHLHFSENVLARVQGRNAQNIQFYKNIMDGIIDQFDGTAIFSNNIITYGYYSNWTWHLPIRTINNALFQNNIFVVAQNPLTSCQNNLLQNNVFRGDFTPNPQTDENIWLDNIYNQPMQEVFVNYVSGAFNPDADYRLLPTSAGTGAGVDGYDAGIYGTATPYKEGATPYNPRVVFQEVSNQTDAEGNISIKVEVEAQVR